ncbi:MAG: DUF177 domain-containing protein [Chitinophagales bacterium]
MKNLRDYLIPYVGLKVGMHRFEYAITGEFFQQFPDSLIRECEVKVRLELEKKETFFILNFFIDGTVNAACDLCLEPFRKEIFGDYPCLVKFSEELSKGANDDDEVMYISRESDFIDVAPLIYDFINLCMPIQLWGCQQPGAEKQCNQEVLKYMNKEKKNDESADPRWEGLRKLKE